MNGNNNFLEKGFIALISVLIVGALVLALTIGISLRSVDDLKIGITQERSSQAAALAGLCAETALMKLKNTLHYAGNESIMVAGESCDILAVEGVGNLNRTVKTQSTVFGHTRKMRVVVQRISPVMQITPWEDVANF